MAIITEGVAKRHKVILNIYIADALVKKGFPIVEVTPSNKLRGRAAFVFRNTEEFQDAMREVSFRE